MIINSPAEFGAAVRNRRKQLHYTQAFLAEFTGFSVSFISDLEHGKKTAELRLPADYADVDSLLELIF